MSQKACSVEDCSKPGGWRGWCVNHYQAWYRTGDPTTLWQYGGPNRPCRVDGCDRKLHSRREQLCAMHLWRLTHHGDVNWERRTSRPGAQVPQPANVVH